MNDTTSEGPTDHREPLGRTVHQARRDFEAERSALKDRPGFLMYPWEERHPEQRELDMQIGAAVAIAATADDRSSLADAQNAIGNAIRWVESQAMTGKLLDPAEVQRVLVGIIFRQWTGGLRVGGVAVQPPAELEAIGTGPLLDPDCRAGKCSSCVGAPCEHECHKEASHG